MLQYWKPVPNHRKLLGCLHFALLMVAVGCNRDGSQTPAAINGQSPTTGGGQGPSLQKPAGNPQHPVVQIETSQGSITLRLDREKAQQTVDNFLSYVTSGHYDQTIVHQVLSGHGFVAGGYGVNMVEKRARTPVFNEARNGLKNLRGTIAMARLPDVIDSATCQFLINVADNPALDHRDETPEGYGYCVFGVVEKGMDVVQAIGEAEVRDTADFDRTPVQPIIIKSIQRIQ